MFPDTENAFLRYSVNNEGRFANGIHLMHLKTFFLHRDQFILTLLKVEPYACDRLKSNNLSFQNAVLEEENHREMTNFCIIHNVLVTAIDLDTARKGVHDD
jgi:hypothetical protein